MSDSPEKDPVPEPTAYQRWLYRESGGHPVELANLMVSEVKQQNRALFDLLDMTGDTVYTSGTMIKAARLLTDMCLTHPLKQS